MKLYTTPLSPYAGRCRMQIYVKGLDVEMIDPFEALSPEAFKAKTPLAKVPALETDDGWVLPESETICEYLEDLYPDPPLLPSDPKGRAKSRVISRIADLYVLGPLAILFSQIDPKTRDVDLVRHNFMELKKGLGWLNTYLEGSSGYAVGDRLTLADCTLVPILYFVRRIPEMFGKTGCLLDDHPNVTAYWKGIFNEPVAGRVHEELVEALKRMR